MEHPVYLKDPDSGFVLGFLYHLRLYTLFFINYYISPKSVEASKQLHQVFCLFGFFLVENSRTDIFRKMSNNTTYFSKISSKSFRADFEKIEIKNLYSPPFDFLKMEKSPEIWIKYAHLSNLDIIPNPLFQLREPFVNYKFK